MLWFILCVAVLNMAAGFGLAVLLAGTTTRNLTIGRSGLSTENASDADFRDIGVALSSELDAVETEEASTSATSEEVADEKRGTAEDVPSELEKSAEVSENSVMADLDAAVSLALGDVALPENENEDLPSVQEEQPLDGQGSSALHAYHAQLEIFCEELAALDDRLRRKPPGETAELRSELDSITEFSLKQDEACQEAEQSLREMIDAESIDEKRGTEILTAMDDGRKETAEAVEAFEQLDPQTDPGTQCEMVLEQTAKLLDSNHDLRDQVSDMILATQTLEDERTSNAKVDPLTEIMSRAALDATLAEHWQKDPHHVRTVSLTVIDLDHFAKFNRSYGPTVGNRVLRALAQLVESESPSDCHVARFAGQRFALLSIDRDLKQAVSDAERMRQTIETVKLEYGENDLEVTVSCGVVAAGPNDTQATFYARAIESVQEAKRYGRNRTFVHEGEYPTPVVPPNFTLNEKHVTV